VLPIQQAARRTGWSPRMLRYLEQLGLIEPRRTAAAYRLFAPDELERLSSLRQLLEHWGMRPADIAFAMRLRDEPMLARAIGRWLDPRPTSDWLHFERTKTLRLLAASAA
jgi:DNA-binding transcriptional MerR regulator